MVGAHGDFLWSPTAAALGWDVDKAMDWLLAHLANGRLNADGLPSRIAEPSEAQDVYEQLLNRKGRNGLRFIRLVKRVRLSASFIAVHNQSCPN